jgi:nitronate monooxygenase
VLRNEFSEKWVGRERELFQQIHEERARYSSARENHDYDTAAVIAGESAALIHDVSPARLIVGNIVREMDAILGYSLYAQNRTVTSAA